MVWSINKQFSGASSINKISFFYMGRGSARSLLAATQKPTEVPTFKFLVQSCYEEQLHLNRALCIKLVKYISNVTNRKNMWADLNKCRTNTKVCVCDRSYVKKQTRQAHLNIHRSFISFLTPSKPTCRVYISPDSWSPPCNLSSNKSSCEYTNHR